MQNSLQAVSKEKPAKKNPRFGAGFYILHVGLQADTSG